MKEKTTRIPWIWLAAGLLLFAVLAGGIFTTFRLSAQSSLPEAEEASAGVQVYEDVFDDGSGPVTVRTIILPSPDLPDRPSEVSGILTRRSDNSLFVGTGSTSVNVNIVDGETSVATDFSGPELEVVIGQDTLVYQDVTEIDYSATEDVERRYTQEVVVVELPEDLNPGATIQVWGEKRGDRVIAEVVVIAEVQ